MPTTNIRKKTLHRPAVILACLVFLCFLWQDGMEGFKTNPLISGGLTLITLLIISYEVIQLIRHKPVMAVSEYGIEFMHHGSYSWEQLVSYWFEDESDVDNFTTKQLIFRLKDGKHIRLHYPDLNKRPEEITSIINGYGHGISFEGHKKIGMK